MDGILQAQSESDAKYFGAISGQDLSTDEKTSVRQGLLKAYRWQYIVSGAVHPKFQEVLGSLVSDAQATRIGDALAPLVEAVH